MGQNQWANVYLLGLGTTDDATTQVYRYIWLQPQRIHATITAAQAELLSDLSLGNLGSSLPEFVFLARVTYRTSASYTTTGKVRIEGVQYLTSSRISFGAAAANPPAVAVSFAPAGSIAASNVQAAIEELDAEKEPVVTAGTTYQVFRGNKTFGTVGLSLTTAQLLALSEADDVMLRFAYCTDCYNLTGTLTGGAVFYDSSTSKWRLTCCGVEATTDMLTFFRSTRDASTGARTGKLNSIRISFAGDRNLIPTISNASYYSTSFSTAIGVALIESSGVGHGSTTTFSDARMINRALGLYYSCVLARNSATHSTSSDAFYISFGFVGNAIRTGGGNLAAFVYDPQNILGTGISTGNTNIHAVTGSGGVFTITDLGVPLEHVAESRKRHEVLTSTAGAVTFYRDGVLVATHSTNIPYSSPMQANQVYERTTSTTTGRGLAYHDAFMCELRA
jgi:hypothetical protein